MGKNLNGRECNIKESTTFTVPPPKWRWMPGSKFWRAFAIRKPVRAVDDIKFLTVEKQEKFLEAAKHSHNYRQYVLLYSNWQRVPAVCLNRATT